MTLQTKHVYMQLRPRSEAPKLHYNDMRPIARPPVVDLSGKFSPVYDQGELGSCTGNAWVGALEYEENIQGEKFVQFSRLFVYFNERVLDNDTDQDAGAEIGDGIKTLTKWGVCAEQLWPYDVNQFTVKPSDAAYEDGLKHMALASAAVSQTENAITHALAAGHPLVFGITVFDSLESDAVAATGDVPMPDVNREQCLGGHAVVIVGYDYNKRTFKVRNSWGADWGDRGYAHFPFDYILNPDLADDFWILTRIS